MPIFLCHSEKWYFFILRLSLFHITKYKLQWVFFLLHTAMVETNFKWRPGDQPWSYCSPFHIQRSWIQQGRVTKFGSIARQEEETDQFHENIHVWPFSSPSNHDESYTKSHRYIFPTTSYVNLKLWLQSSITFLGRFATLYQKTSIVYFKNNFLLLLYICILCLML